MWNRSVTACHKSCYKGPTRRDRERELCWAPSYAWYLLLADSGPNQQRVFFLFHSRLSPGPGGGWCNGMWQYSGSLESLDTCSMINKAAIFGPALARPESALLSQEPGHVTIPGHHWSCANIDLDTRGWSLIQIAKLSRVQSASVVLGPIARPGHSGPRSGG